MHDAKTIQSEKGLRDLIGRNLRKEFHPGTKPSIDFIHKILEEAHESGMPYDVSDLRPRIMAFANNSTNQAWNCLKLVQSMKFKSDVEAPTGQAKDERLVFFDVEVYPNLFVVCWKFEDAENVVKMINPTPTEVEALFNLKLVGFHNRGYDNHILYARFMGYDNEALFNLSQKLVNNEKSATFGEAYGLSYTDIYDFSSKKQGLKKFMIELGLPHVEMDIPWDKPVPEDKVMKVVDYCVNDVLGTEATFKARKQDFVARQILAELSGLSVNDTTQKHTARIIFGKDKDPQKSFVYTQLEEEFPGYVYDFGKSIYGEDEPSEGGYVYAEPGIYEDVAVLDVASMHPTSIIKLNLFGPYTKNFEALVNARLAIKHREYWAARELLGPKVNPYLKDDSDAEALAYALKIVVNIVYGLTSAKFDNPFRDIRNKDNIVAKRGALFMIDLRRAVQQQGYTVAHIKTDSIKIPHADRDVINFVMQFGEQYGYTFEHETTYKKMCLVNDAVYIARDEDDKWEAVGAQFQHPYVFKSLFSGEDVTWNDLTETKQVTKGSIYIDFESVQNPMFKDNGTLQFIGRIGQFVPVTKNSGGGILYRIHEDKRYHVSGTKGYFWLEASVAQDAVKEDQVEIDMDYFEKLGDAAVKSIEKFGSFEQFIK